MHIFALVCVYVHVHTTCAYVSYFQVHVSLQGINCCELSDSAAVFVQPHAEEQEKW